MCLNVRGCSRILALIEVLSFGLPREKIITRISLAERERFIGCLFCGVLHVIALSGGPVYTVVVKSSFCLDCAVRRDLGGVQAIVAQ